MLEIDQAEKECAEAETRAADLLKASRDRYAEAEKAVEHLRVMQQRVDTADDLEALAAAMTYRDSAERLVEITAHTAFLASGQHVTAENRAKDACERLRALTAALSASERAGDVLGGPAAPIAGDALPALDEEN